MKHAAHRLVQHTLQFMRRWHGQMKALYPFFGIRATGNPQFMSLTPGVLFKLTHDAKHAK